MWDLAENQSLLSLKKSYSCVDSKTEKEKPYRERAEETISMQKQESITHETEIECSKVSQSDTTNEKESAKMQQSSLVQSSQSTERSLESRSYLSSKLERSLELSVESLEKCVEGIAIIDENSEEAISVENIDAASKLIDVCIKLIAVKERL